MFLKPLATGAFFYALYLRFLWIMQQIKQLVKRLFPRFLNRGKISAVSKRGLLEWGQTLQDKPRESLANASYDIFTYHGEDGIIYYLLQQLKDVPPVFVDIGSGDGIKSNCATLAIHFGWKGIFLDSNAGQLAIGKNFYKHKIAGNVIRMVNEEVTPANINPLLTREKFTGEIGLLSVDIDGNDYWVWEAIEVIQPKIVVIETKVEYGGRNVVVPYGKHNHHSANKMYNGASVEALRKLGKRKGYTLAGANRYGYNLFFVKDSASVPVATTDTILNDPETKRSFYPESFFSSHTFVQP